MSTPTPSVPGVDREDLADAIRRATITDNWLAAYHAADAALAHIAAHHECALPATWDDDGARPVEGEHGWVTPLLPDGEGTQRFPEGAPVEVWQPGYGNGLRTLYYVAGIGRTSTFGGARYSASWREGTLIRPALPPTSPACDRDHADEWVEVDGKTLGGLPGGTRVRTPWVLGGGAASSGYLVHRDDLPDDPVDERVKVMARALAEHVGSGDPDDAEMWLDDAEDVLAALLDEHGWTVTRKGER